MTPSTSPASHEPLRAALTTDAEARGIRLASAPMDIERPAAFDGLSITLNPRRELEARCYYLAHSFGSIVGWSVDFDRVASFQARPVPPCPRRFDEQEVKQERATPTATHKKSPG